MGELSFHPDGKDEAKPNTTLGMAAVGLDGCSGMGGQWRHQSLTTTAHLLTVKTPSEAVDGLDSSEGNLSRLCLGLEACQTLSPVPASPSWRWAPSKTMMMQNPALAWSWGPASAEGVQSRASVAS